MQNFTYNITTILLAGVNITTILLAGVNITTILLAGVNITTILLNITTILLAGVLVASSQMGIFYSLLIKTTMRSFECKLKAGLIPVSVGTLWSRQVDDGKQGLYSY